MARPKAKELTERELEIMHVFWDATSDPECGIAAPDVRERLAATGRDLAYTTVATLVRILTEKGFLEQTSDQRPFTYRPLKTFDEVSSNFLSDMLQRVFQGSREQLLVRLMDQKKLTAKERSVLEQILKDQKKKR